MLLISLLILVALGGGFIFLGLRHKAADLDDYITHRGKTGTLATAFSLAASVLGGWILFSPAETGTWAGIAGLTGYALGQAMPLFILAFAGPYLLKKLPKGYGLSDFLYKRYGRKSALVTSVLMLFYMGTFLTAELTAIGQVFSFTFQVPLWLSCWLIMGFIFAYVFQGGLGASIRTDKVQLYLLIPLIIILGEGATWRLSESTSVFSLIQQEAPQLISFSFWPGLEFGLVLFIGVAASNLFHQGFWQRVYSLKENHSQKRAFLGGGLLVIPIIFIPGLLGIFASTGGILQEGQGPLALFHLIKTLSPVYTLVLIVLAFVLVMSSIDTLLNGMVSNILSWKGMDDSEGNDLKKSQILTGVIGVAAILLGSRGGSVLYLFLLADLLCSALAFPLLFGLFNRYLTGPKALISGIIGLAAGAPFFPKPDFSSWSGLPANMLVAFSLALGISVVFTCLSALWDRKLSRQVLEVA